MSLNHQWVSIMYDIETTLEDPRLYERESRRRRRVRASADREVRRDRRRRREARESPQQWEAFRASLGTLVPFLEGTESVCGKCGAPTPLGALVCSECMY